MATNAYLSMIESKKQNKQRSRTETDSQIQGTFGHLQDEGGLGEKGKKGEGIKKYKLVLQNSLGDVKYSIENIIDNILITT